jgi:uncharacterized protein (TIGR02452 family)
MTAGAALPGRIQVISDPELEAFRAAVRSDPSLVIVDVILPGLILEDRKPIARGSQFFTRLSALPPPPPAAVLLPAIPFGDDLTFPVLAVFAPSDSLPPSDLVSLVVDSAVWTGQRSLLIGPSAFPTVSVAVAAAFRVQLVLKRKRFAFSSIIFSFPPEIRFFADLFPDTPDSVWHRTSSVDEFPMDRHRGALRAVADDNAARYAAQSYCNRRGKTVDLAALIARSATTAIPPDAPLVIAAAADRPGRIELTQETTIGALYRLVVVEWLADVVALNYANAVSPGGGYLDGARAQEEACCRASTLYYELAAHGGEMYEFNAYGDDGEGFGSLASDFELITRDVIVWRDDRDPFLDRPFLSAFVHSASTKRKGLLRNTRTGRPRADRSHARPPNPEDRAEHHRQRASLSISMSRRSF